MDKAHSRVGHTTSLYLSVSVSFYLSHAVAFSVFNYFNDMYAFIVMLDMCVLYVSLVSSVTPNSVCVFMCSVMLYYARSGVDSVHAALSDLT